MVTINLGKSLNLEKEIPGLKSLEKVLKVLLSWLAIMFKYLIFFSVTGMHSDCASCYDVR